jgi:hypothetical protein
MKALESDQGGFGGSPSDAWRWSLVETALIFVLFFVLAGSPPPGVNEAHYLAKARHYWDPQWCAGDIFLESADAHLVFYWTFGWLTLWLPLGGAAWVCRVVTWLLLAWSWRRLSWALVPERLYSLLTAGLFTGLLRWCHMAGEWVVGGVEAKCLAYALTFFALDAMVRGRWLRVWLLLGAASSFHVLVGGWSVVAAGFTWWLSTPRPALRTQVIGLSGGLLLALPGIVPALTLNWGVEPETARQATEIYVTQRLPHHLLLFSFPTRYLLRFAALLILWVFMVWRLSPAADARRLYTFVVGALLIAAVGVLLEGTLAWRVPNAVSLLRFYWYRLADVMLPLGATFACAQLVARRRRTDSKSGALWLCGVILLVSAHVTHVAYKHRIDPRPEALAQPAPRTARNAPWLAARARDWRDVCAWIESCTPPDAVFLTPRGQQTFKWYAQRSEVANWKDVPQDARALVRWWERFQELYPNRVAVSGLAAHGEAELRRFAEQHGFRFIVIDRARSRRGLRFPRVYPTTRLRRSYYEVYQLPPADR